MSFDRLLLASIEDEDQDFEDSSSSTPATQSETFMVGFIVANIVGLQYYRGRISGREMVGLVREPLNAYNSNAIKVVNTRTIQVGHIEKKVASVLAPLLDSNLVHVEGIVPKTPKSAAAYRIPCHIHVFSKMEAFETVKSALRSFLFTPNDPMFSISDSMVVKEKKKGDLDEIFKLIDDNLRENAVNGVMEPPQDFILPDLFQHQKEGLYWLHHRENSDELPPFWEKSDDGFTNVLTNYQSDIRPEPLRGGIFADDMGLGKTLTLLSLIALDKCNDVNANEELDDEVLVVPSGKRRKGKVPKTIKPRKKQKKEENTSEIRSKTTLIVCPPSVFSTWITQITDHTKRGKLKVYMYYGGDRTQDVSELKKYDIVLTTYSTLGCELSNMNTPIKKIEWWRVILDEAHVIKNHKANQSVAVTNLNAKRRWVVTGTPIQNGSMDLFSLMAFLRFDPFSVKSYWDTLVQRPIVQGNAKGLSRLQALMGTISLRRTKEKALIGLPPKTVHTCNVELSIDERSTNEMEFPSRYPEHYLRLLESVTYGTRTDLGKRWSEDMWSNFAKELGKECGGNRITPFMCTEHLKRLRTIKNIMDDPEKAKSLDRLHVRDLDESYKTRVHKVLYVGSPSIPESSSQSYCSNPSARASCSKRLVIEEMEKLLELFFDKKHITLAEHIYLAGTLLRATASCKLVLKLDDYDLQLQHIKTLTKKWFVI